MITAMHNIYNIILPSFRSVKHAPSYHPSVIYPFLLNGFADEWDFNKRFDPVEFPSSDSYELFYSAFPSFRNHTSENIQQNEDFQIRSSALSETGKDSLASTSGGGAADRCPSALKGGGRVTVQYGDFLAVYGERWLEESKDMIVTCFFLDTARDLLQYIAVISRLLVSGGRRGRGGGTGNVCNIHSQLLSRSYMLSSRLSSLCT